MPGSSGRQAHVKHAEHVLGTVVSFHLAAFTADTLGQAVATSGMAERGPHIIDPHTVQPATQPASVTVVGSGLTLEQRLLTRVVDKQAVVPAPQARG